MPERDSPTLRLVCVCDDGSELWPQAADEVLWDVVRESPRVVRITNTRSVYLGMLPPGHPVPTRVLVQTNVFSRDPATWVTLADGPLRWSPGGPPGPADFVWVAAGQIDLRFFLDAGGPIT